ncbi:MAG: S8 family serine peptidase [Salibacteraceae bacterium]
MKVKFTIIAVLFCTLGFAQPRISAINLALLKSTQNKKQKPEQYELHNYSITKILGKDYISTIAVTEKGFNPENLPSSYVKGSNIGNIITLRIPLDEISEIKKIKHIEYLEFAQKINPLVDKAILDLRADSVHGGINLNQSYTGKNVIIGVTDWGFDYSNPMFYDTSLTHTRILASWDQFKTSGPAPSGFSYGTEYVGETELLAAQSDTACSYYDYATHGSHVAGIAAGSGADVDLRGVAFESEYLFAALGLDMASAIDAVSWMKDIADAEGKRLVVNMSWGLYYLGPLDGTSIISQAFDAFADEGVIIVTSGGNNGNDEFHIKKEFNSDSVVTKIDFYPYSAHASMWGQSVSMWGEKQHPFSARLEVYQNGALIMNTPTYSTNTAVPYLDSILVNGQDTVFFNLATDSAHPQNEVPHMRLRVKNTNTSLTIVLRSYAVDGIVHYYNVTELSNGAGNWGMPFTAFGPNGSNGDSHYSIGEPACGKSVISIAAHSSEVRAPNGTVYDGSLANFSSEGPTIDGRVKPDISAPGVGVASSISSYTTASYTTFKSTTFNGRTYDFAKFSGTSMSSPATTGVVALMLEANPGLTPNEVKNILQITAREDSKTGSLPPNGSFEWGFGKVNAYAAVKEASRLLTVNDNPIFSDIQIYPTLASEQLNIQSNQNQPFTFKVFDTNGKQVLSGHAVSSININELEAGTYILHLTCNFGFGVKKFIKM